MDAIPERNCDDMCKLIFEVSVELARFGRNDGFERLEPRSFNSMALGKEVFSYIICNYQKESEEATGIHGELTRRKGKYIYLYRAVDKNGLLIDFMLSEKRDIASAIRFFEKAIKTNEDNP